MALAMSRMRRLRHRLRDERSDPAPRHDDTFALEREINLRHGVGVDAKVNGKLTHGRQLVARPHPSRGDGDANAPLELRVDGRPVVSIDGDGGGHMSSCTTNLVHHGEKVKKGLTALRNSRTRDP